MTDDLASFLDRIVLGRTYRRVTGALAAFGALVLPSSCVVCGAWDSSLCLQCSARFRSATARPFDAEAGAESLPDVERTTGRDGRDGRRTTTDADWPTGTSSTSGTSFGPLPVVAAGRYGRCVSLVLLAYKDHGHVDLAAPVAAALAGALHGGISRLGTADPPTTDPVLIVPVPTRASSRRRRGYDPLMLLLARLDRSGRLPAGTELAPAVRQLPLPVRLAHSRRRGKGASVARAALTALLPGLGGGQKGLGRRGRRANVLHSMGTSRRIPNGLGGRRCLIVDDVLTTGATIAEVHRVLVAGGASVLGAVVLAATAAPAGRGGPEPRSRTAAGP